MEQYYAIRELEPLVQTLKDADDDVDQALERQEAAIKALADAWTALEDKRAALSEAAE
jgi:hypothetical protein